MLDKFNVLKVSAVLLTALLFVQPAQAFTSTQWSERYDSRSNRHDGWDNHGRSDRHDRYDHDRRYFKHHRGYYPTYGKAVITLPGGYFSIVFGGERYYYSSGIFYKRGFRHYEVAIPPVGVVIRSLPSDCDRVVIRGQIYHVSNGVYYKPSGRGYVVVDQPDVVIEDTDVSSANVSGEYTIHIPNNNGSYTAVTLNKANGGFTGPQGEFYPEFPSVEQLKVVYGK